MLALLQNDASTRPEGEQILLSLFGELLEQRIRIPLGCMDEQLEVAAHRSDHPTDVGESLVDFVADGAYATSAFCVWEVEQPPRERAFSYMARNQDAIARVMTKHIVIPLCLAGLHHTIRRKPNGRTRTRDVLLEETFSISIGSDNGET